MKDKYITIKELEDMLEKARDKGAESDDTIDLWFDTIKLKDKEVE